MATEMGAQCWCYSKSLASMKTAVFSSLESYSAYSQRTHQFYFSVTHSANDRNRHFLKPQCPQLSFYSHLLIFLYIFLFKIGFKLFHPMRYIILRYSISSLKLWWLFAFASLLGSVGMHTSALDFGKSVLRWIYLTITCSGSNCVWAQQQVLHQHFLH